MRNDKSPSPAELETPIREKLQDNPMTNPIPPRALPQCTCQSDYHIIPREYATGTHYWLSCIACGARGHQAAPKRLLPKHKLEACQTRTKSYNTSENACLNEVSRKYEKET
jgi:hypothetical protein